MFRFICSALMVAGSTAASVNAQPTQVSRPDLTITSSLPVPNGNRSVFVKNQGTVSAAVCTMSVKVFSPAGTLVRQTAVFVPSIVAGQTVRITAPVGNMAPGMRLDFKVDSNNSNVELNESNNTHRIIIVSTSP